MKILYLTTTGNSLSIAKRIGGELLSIPQLHKSGMYDISDDDAIGIVFPVWFGNVPAEVKRFLTKCRLEAPYTFAMITYGSNLGLTPNYLKKIMEFDYVAAIEMVDNYVPMFNVEKQVESLPRKKVPEHLEPILDDIATRRHKQLPVGIIGHLAGWGMKLYSIPSDAYKRWNMHPDKCVRYGVCYKACPIGNVKFDGKNPPSIGERCTLCGGCYHNCPQQAIQYKRVPIYCYRNPSVTLPEILRSNNQH